MDAHRHRHRQRRHHHQKRHALLRRLPTDTLGGTSEITIDPNATLQLNNGAKIIGSACEIFTSGTLRGTGTLQAPIISSGTLIPDGGTLTLAGNANLTGKVEFPTPADKLAVTGNLELTGVLRLPAGLPAGRHLLITHTGTLNTGEITFINIPPSFTATLDLTTAGEVAVILADQSGYQTWQIEHFETLDNPDGLPTADPDGDGMTNSEEFEAGTDPNDEHSFISLIWQGAPNNRWDLATTAAWLENTTPRVFRDHRHVIINDSGSNTPSLDLLGSLQPGSITISNTTKAYTLGGTGSIGGTTGLTKSGDNTLTISTPNSYTGATTIDAGVIEIHHATALGSSEGSTSVAPNARLELGGGITVTGEPVTLSGIGGTAFYNGALNSKSGTNTWTGPVTLAASGTRIGAQANATLIVSGPISSDSGVTIRPNDMTSTVILSGDNSYSGDTNVIGGVLKLGAANTLPVTTPLKLGASNVSGKLDLAGFNQEIAALSVTQTTGTLTNNEVTSATPAVLTINTAVTSSYSGRFTGSLTLAKSGPATLSLTAATALAATTTVHLDAGVLDLPSSHTIAALRLNGFWQPAGIYHSGNSSNRISGSGTLTVTTSGISDFNSWIDSFDDLVELEKPANADPDHDGNNNLIEWALQLDPTQPDHFQPILTQTGGTLEYTYTRAKNVQATFAVEWSDTLAGDWSTTGVTAESPVSETDSTRTVQVTLPAGTHGKRFIRLRILQN
jgi:autotransporter-associated beta strand protein